MRSPACGVNPTVVFDLESLATTPGLDDAGDEGLNQIRPLGGGLIPTGPVLHKRPQNLGMDRARRIMASTFGRPEGDPEAQFVDSLILPTKQQMRAAVDQGLVEWAGA
jgi:hypothetical protein